jgi:hypothetical protein
MTTYQRRRAARECVQCGRRPAYLDAVYCPTCVAKRRPKAREYERRRREARWEAPGVNKILCCGHWWHLTQLPLRTPCCDRVHLGWLGDIPCPAP